MSIKTWPSPWHIASLKSLYHNFLRSCFVHPIFSCSPPPISTLRSRNAAEVPRSALWHENNVLFSSALTSLFDLSKCHFLGEASSWVWVLTNRTTSYLPSDRLLNWLIALQPTLVIFNFLLGFWSTCSFSFLLFFLQPSFEQTNFFNFTTSPSLCCVHEQTEKPTWWAYAL